MKYASSPYKYATFDEIRRWVEEYERIHLGHVERVFEVKIPSIPDELRHKPIEGPGCYAVYGESGSLWYIGMAEKHVSARALSHLRPKVLDSPFWREHEPFKIGIILTREPWEPHSLEAFLTAQKKEFEVSGEQH